MEKILKIGRKIIPKKIFKAAQPIYHYLLAFVGAIIYKFPGKKILVIGVTGTKGKSTTTEMVNAIFEAAGYKTAVQNTIRFKIADKERSNKFKMTMPGRFFIQQFLRDSINSGCDVAILEMSSEGSKQFRHKFVYPDALIFTNLSPEHIESHGSYEKYVKAKLSIAEELIRLKVKFFQKVLGSPRPGLVVSQVQARPDIFSRTSLLTPAIIANIDDKESEKFLALNIPNKIKYSLNDAVSIKSDSTGSTFQIKKTVIHSKLPGMFNVSNMIGAIKCAEFFGISTEQAKIGLEKMDKVRGRMEKILVDNSTIPEFDVVVDYAHTKESLEAIYGAYKNHTKICVLGNTGGGRDKWKRKVMAEVADQNCDHIILTNEDPYDEDPMEIINEMKRGVTKKPLDIIINRREAIRFAISKAKELTHSKSADEKIAVLITGKGTDPYIMGPNGTKEEWDDARVAREELQKLLSNSE